MLLSIDSLITTASKIIDPNNDAPAKYKQKTTFKRKKCFFRVFCQKSRNGLLDNFVERIELYYHLAVQEKPTLFEWNEKCNEKIFKIDFFKNDPNNDGQQFFFPNNDAFKKIGIWLYIGSKLIYILITRWIRIIFHNFILYFMKTQFFVPGVPLRDLKNFFCLPCANEFYRSIEQVVLITNMTFFFKISRLIREI